MNGPPRVLAICENETVPADRRVWQQCLALVAAGYGVSVIAPARPGGPAYEERDDVELHFYPAPAESGSKLSFVREFAVSWLWTARLAVKVWRQRGFVVLQTANPPDTYFALALVFKALGVRFVFDMHDLSPELYISRFGEKGRFVLAALRLLERLSLATADHVITTNAWYRQLCLERGARSPDHVTVVRNGPDLDVMTPRAPKPQLKHGREALCCFLGVMEPHDGVETAIHAAADLIHRRGRTDCHFAFLGDGESAASLHRLVERLDLSNWVTFTGWADDDTIVDYLSTADIGLQPDPKDARIDISTATKTMEYMAFALPVVAFDLKETRASAGPAAIYARGNTVQSFADAIADLLDDPERRRRMGAMGRRRVEETLSWNRQRETYVTVIRELIGSAVPAGEPWGQGEPGPMATVHPRHDSHGLSR